MRLIVPSGAMRRLPGALAVATGCNIDAIIADSFWKASASDLLPNHSNHFGFLDFQFPSCFTSARK
jgi:hypothetical protein